MKYLKAFSPSHGILDNSKEVFFFFWERAFLFKSRSQSLIGCGFQLFLFLDPKDLLKHLHLFIRSSVPAVSPEKSPLGYLAHDTHCPKTKTKIYATFSESSGIWNITFWAVNQLFAVQLDQTNMTRPIWPIWPDQYNISNFPGSSWLCSKNHCQILLPRKLSNAHDLHLASRDQSRLGLCYCSSLNISNSATCRATKYPPL